METGTLDRETIGAYLDLSPRFAALSVKHVWVDYDREADVLYLSFLRPQRAKKTVEMDDGVLVQTDNDEIVGLTILDVSSR